ncbi:hypothetical protein KAT80_00160 [Candidatus Pacearchaeota archaeon]|nr:hypothetical protein [Candidatus Pacearchaeota archaeon]
MIINNLKVTRKKLVLISLFLLILPSIYAVSYGSGNYSDGIYGAIDIDNDGIEDDDDNLLYNETNVATSGLTQLNITVGGSSTGGSHNGNKRVLFYDQDDLMVNFTHNFGQSNVLDLSKVEIQKSSTYLIVNFSGQLSNNKTLYLEDNSFVNLCVKDAEINSVDEISSGCNGDNETDFTTCLENSNVTINGITCTDEGSRIRVENLQYSAIRGTTSSPTTPSSPGGSSSKKKSNATILLTPQCKPNYTCSSWSFCSDDFTQTRVCTDLNNCGNKSSKPKEIRECPNILFDSIIELNSKKVYPWRKLSFKVNLKEVNSSDLVDVKIIYRISKNQITVYEESETRAIQDEIIYEKEISKLDLIPGEYSLSVIIQYGKAQTASAEKNFSVVGLTSIIIFSVILVIIFLLVFISYNWYRLRKHEEKIEEKLEDIEEKLEEKQPIRTRIKNKMIEKIKTIGLESLRKKENNLTDSDNLIKEIIKEKEESNKNNSNKEIIEKIESKRIESIAKNKGNNLKNSDELIKELNKKKY